jgi:hypothetical protein
MMNTSSEEEEELDDEIEFNRPKKLKSKSILKIIYLLKFYLKRN